MASRQDNPIYPGLFLFTIGIAPLLMPFLAPNMGSTSVVQGLPSVAPKESKPGTGQGDGKTATPTPSPTPPPVVTVFSSPAPSFTVTKGTTKNNVFNKLVPEDMAGSQRVVFILVNPTGPQQCEFQPGPLRNTRTGKEWPNVVSFAPPSPNDNTSDNVDSPPYTQYLPPTTAPTPLPTAPHSLRLYPVNLTFRVDNQGVSAGRYSGRVVIAPISPTKYSAVPIDYTVNVRAQLGWPCFWLIAGALVGYLFRRSIEPLAQAQEALVARYLLLMEQIKALAEDTGSVTIKAEILNDMVEARRVIELTTSIAETEKASAKLDAVSEKIKNAANTVGVNMVMGMIRSGSKAVVTWRDPFWSFAHPRCWLALFSTTALVLTGYFVVYIGDSTFGANGIFDYMKCILWGVGSDAMTRALQYSGLTRAS